MASSKFENIWKLMSNHCFEVDGMISSSTLCSICCKLLIEPYTSICGCHFCGVCIRKFKSGGDMHCPGKSSDCQNTLLEIDKNVVIDFTTQINITKLVVKCPYYLCSHSLELEKMEEHMRFCSMRPMSCPYQSIGCLDRGISSNSVHDHLISDALIHSQLLIEALNNLKNDFDNQGGSKPTEIKEQSCQIGEFVRKEEVTRNEINDLKEIMKCKDEVIRNLINEIDNIKREVKIPKNEIEKVKKEAEKNAHEFSLFQREYSVFKTAMEVFQCNCSKAGDKGKLGDDSLQKLTTKTDEMKIEIGDTKKSIEKISKIVEKDVQNKMKKSDKDLSAAKADINKNSEEMKKMDFKLNELTIKATKDFTWRVNPFSKQAFPVRSNEFHKNYYKFCLDLASDGHKLRLSLRVVKGEFDEQVEWPMKQMFTLGFVNQSTMVVFKSDKYGHGSTTGDKLGFNRPTNEMNSPIGALSVAIKDVKSASGVLLNDSLILFCSVGSNVM